MKDTIILFKRNGWWWADWTNTPLTYLGLRQTHYRVIESASAVTAFHETVAPTLAVCVGADPEQ